MSTMSTMYIYKTTNTVNGKIYIGKRIYNERSDKYYLGSGIYLNRAIKKYGRINFTKEIIEWCTKDILSEREIYWIKFCNATNSKVGYNISNGGDGGNLGDEVNRRISKSLKGRKKSIEFCQNISNKLSGVPKTAEHNEKVRQSLLGRKRPPETVLKMSKSIQAKYDNGWISSRCIQVHQYDILTGNYIQTFNSIAEANRSLNVTGKRIYNNCNKKTESAYGFIWARDKLLTIF